MKKYILPFMIGMVLSGCLAPNVPVDKTELDRCKQKDTSSCINIAKQIQTQYDTAVKNGDEKKNLDTMQKDILKHYDLACEYGDFNSCDNLASIYSSKALELYKSDDKQAAKEAKTAYIYLRKACDIDKTKCPLEPQKFFAKNDEKLANIVWLALKDESPKTLAKADSKYDFAQACLIRGEIRDYMSQCHKTMFSALDYVDLSQKYNCGSNDIKSCLLDAIHSNPYPRSYLKLHYGLSLDKYDIKTIVTYHDERLQQDKDYKPYIDEYNIVHKKLQKALSNGTYEHFEPNSDNTCIKLQNPNNFLYLQLIKKDKELDELNQNIITQYNEHMQKILGELVSGKDALAYIDCTKDVLQEIDKLADSKDSAVYETIMGERTKLLLSSCTRDKSQCEKILKDEILTDDDKDVFRYMFYKAMNGNEIDYRFMYTSKPKNINEKIITKYTYIFYPQSTRLINRYLDELKRGEGEYEDQAFESVMANGWEFDHLDLANYYIMKALQEGADKLKADIRKIISQNPQDLGNIYAKLKQDKHDKFINEFSKIYKGFVLESHTDEFVKTVQSSAGDDMVEYCFYSYMKDSVFSSKAKYPDASSIQRKINQKLNTLKTKPLAQMNTIITQKRLEKERLQKQKEMEEARLQKQKEMQRIKEEKERAKKEKERKEAFERCKKTPQCLAQLKAKTQSLRQQSRKYYMMATNARTKQEYNKYKQLADVACARAMSIEQTGEDSGLLGLVFGGAENCL